MIRQFVFFAAAACAALACGSASAQDSDAAARFGARPGVEDISLSPDGKSIAFIVPQAGQGNALYTMPLAGETPKRILVASGDPEQLRGCGWVSNDRLLCTVFTLRKDLNLPVTFSRLVAVDAAGGNVKLVSLREGVDALGQAVSGGTVVDWLPGEDGLVLIGRTYVPEERIGTNVSSRLTGFGVDRVNTRSLDFKRVEAPRRDAVEYISDGAGHVRIMGTQTVTDAGYARDSINYLFRRAGSGDWEALGRYDLLTGEGFNPFAVDAARNVAYGFRKAGGLYGLYELSLDGNRAERKLLANPEVDVDGLIRIGRSRRVVGATFVTEKRQAVYFDEEMKRLAASLGKALPQAPQINFVGASLDESSLLLWAGSDVDPGRYFLFDKATKQLRQLMLERPELDGVVLAPVKPVRYRAADGTMVPAYLTLPPGAAGKDLPAIVLPHGGPASRDEWGFDWLAQYFANRGYAVLQPNFRGSAGYGDAWFEKNGFQSWRTAVGDVVDAGKWLVSEGIAAPSKLAILGWSYGGYAALQSAVLSPDTFKAVIAIAPVTDLAQLRTDSLNYASGRIAADYIGSGPHLREGSPAQQAAAIRAPVLLFHGTMDSNVLVGQSRLMDDRLKDAGKRHELVIYPGLDHQLDDSAARADLLRRSDAFLRAAMGM
jgi:dienelactone hydrolase